MLRARKLPIVHARNAGVQAEGVVFSLAAVVVASSAVLTKEATRAPGSLPALAATSTPDGAGRFVTTANTTRSDELKMLVGPDLPEPVIEATEPAVERWFDGRPLRRAGTRTMIVTAYSPDERSCGAFADGQTATLHSVWTNGMRLVAADTDLLPFGTLLSVPGYAEDSVVPVLDRGGAIKGRRLDLLMPTHEQAMAWGRQELQVTVWEYADGEPPTDPRKAR
ncbi:MAG: 3D domain-containing protein [Phycisphaerales bacterium]